MIVALPEWIGALLQAESRPHDREKRKRRYPPSPGNPYDVDPIHSLKGDDLHIPPSPYPSPQRGEEKSLFYPSPPRGEGVWGTSVEDLFAERYLYDILIPVIPPPVFRLNEPMIHHRRINPTALLNGKIGKAVGLKQVVG